MTDKNLVYQTAFGLVFKATKNTFPFENKKEFLSFKKYYDQEKSKILPLVKNDEDFFIFLENFLSELKNSHTKLGFYPGKIFFKPSGYRTVLIEKRFFLNKKNKIIGEILAIDGQEPKKALALALKNISGPTKQYAIQKGLNFLLADKGRKPLQIKLKMNNKNIWRKLERQKIIYQPYKKNIETKIFSNNIGYWKIRSWENKQISDEDIETTLRYFSNNKIRALIIDLRGNLGGNSNIAKTLASHFFNKQVLFSITKRRKAKSNFILRTSYSYVRPQKPYLELPIVLLIDTLGFSSNEYFIAGMKDNKRAILLGETTGGGSGNPIKLIFPFKKSFFELFISTWLYFRPNGQPLEGRGIKPHIIIKPRIKDLLAQNDAVLRRARAEAKRLIKR